jgi:MFS family permease
MDKAGAMIGLLFAGLVVWLAQANSLDLSKSTFQTIVLFSLAPSVLAVLSLAFGAKDVLVMSHRAAPKFSLLNLGKPFNIFLFIVSIFTLGNSSDGFLVLRAQNLGISVTGILVMLAIYNLIITLVATPAGSLSDKIGRRRLIIGGWLIYAAIYFGFALAQTAWQIWLLYILYGIYFGMAFGTANALVSDLVPENMRGSAFGTYHAVIGLLAFPSSLIAGILWEGIGAWDGFGPSGPFIFGGTLALLASFLMAIWLPKVMPEKKLEIDLKS